jgi:hypothetical protein
VDALEATEARGCQRGADLGGVMSVVVDYGDAALLAARLETAVHAAEAGQGFANQIRRDFQFQRYGRRRGGIQHIVPAGDAQVKRAQRGLAVAQAEIAGEGTAADVSGFQIRLGAGAVRDGAAPDGRQNSLHVIVVHADDGRTVKRNLVDELDERGADFVERGVVIQVLAIDVGDDSQDRRELQERAVALVGFHHQKVAVAHARVRTAHGRDPAAHHHRGVQARVVQNGGGERGGGGFAVAAGDGDAVLQAHQLGQQLAARNHRDLQTGGLLAPRDSGRQPRS